MDRELSLKIRQGIKGVAGVEPFLILPVAAFHLAVVPGSIGFNDIMGNAKLL